MSENRMPALLAVAAGVRRNPFVPDEVKRGVELLIEEICELRARLAELEKQKLTF